MSWSTRCILAILLAVTAAADVPAQEARTEHVADGGLALAPGRKVRLTYRLADSVRQRRALQGQTPGPGVVVGTLQSLRRDEVTVRNGGGRWSKVVAVPRTQLVRMEVWQGRDWRRSTLGALAGGIAGTGMAMYGRQRGPVLALGGIVGTLIGGLQFGERWEARPLPGRWADGAGR